MELKLIENKLIEEAKKVGLELSYKRIDRLKEKATIIYQILEEEKKNYKGEVFEEAPYKENKDLPEQVKVLPSEAQDLWRRVFNESYSKGEDYARKIAWTVVKKVFKKDKDGNWVKKTKTKGEDGEWIDLENASIDEIFEEITKLQEMELRDKQIQIANKLLKEEN